MINVLFYRDPKTGIEPCKEWLVQLPYDCRAKAIARFKRLQNEGRQLQRPHIALLRDEIYEIRWKQQHTNYRILFFWHGDDVVFLSHGFTKQQGPVPDSEIDLAVRRKKEVESHG